MKPAKVIKNILPGTGEPPREWKPVLGLTLIAVFSILLAVGAVFDFPYLHELTLKEAQ